MASRFQQAKAWLLRHWHTENPRRALVRDVIVAALVVGLLLGVIWGYTGQPFPKQAPVVSVESGSMMHGRCLQGQCDKNLWEDKGFGRVGTIDPGDIVFVKRVKGVGDVEVAFGGGKRSGYGAHGDVLVYRPNGSSSTTAIIHRAMLYIEGRNTDDPNAESCTPNKNCRYVIPAACDNQAILDAATESDAQVTKYCDGSSDPITLHLKRGGLFLNMDNFPCPVGSGGCGPYGEFFSGFITKGDNNANYDEDPSGFRLTTMVRLSWVVGKARGEVPWFGLIKLALYGNKNYSPDNDPTKASNWKIIAATAPWDIWVCLFLAIGILISIPVVIDFVGNRIRARRGEPPETK